MEHPLALDLMMVSHLDDDHINGLLALLDAESALADEMQPPTIQVIDLWINVFDDLLSDANRSINGAATAAFNSVIAGAHPSESGAVIASIPQGQRLRNAARRLQIGINRPFKSGLVTSESGNRTVSFGDLALHIIGPRSSRIDDLHQRWQDFLATKARKDGEAMANAAAFVDRSVFNLSSIVVLARRLGRSVLLTGDARGDDILQGLEQAKLLTSGALHVDVLKVPHHGSSNNVSEGFFRQITADQYVFSGDGKHDNPDRETLEMLMLARRGQDYSVTFTYRLPYVVTFMESIREAGEQVQVRYRPERANSITVEIN